MPVGSREINLIVIHCADTPTGMNVTASDIDRWHRERGFDSIGYHHIILIDGTVEPGRNHDTPGAHVRGYNERSIGVCLIGRDEFTDAQMASLEGVVSFLKAKWPAADVVGHCDLDKGKTCPNFNVLNWWNDVRHRVIG